VQVRQHPRRPAAAVLSAAALLAAAVAVAVPPGRPAGDDAEVDRRIAAGDADAQTWVAFARRLESRGDPRHAAAAYERALARDPYLREARAGRAQALARAGDAEELYRFLHELVFSDPQLTLDLLGRAEMARFLPAPRFQALASEARSQAID
jgi:tetratricopeptide (TPR) repeat protein